MKIAIGVAAAGVALLCIAYFVVHRQIDRARSTVQPTRVESAPPTAAADTSAPVAGAPAKAVAAETAPEAKPKPDAVALLRALAKALKDNDRAAAEDIALSTGVRNDSFLAFIYRLDGAGFVLQSAFQMPDYDVQPWRAEI